MYRGYRYRHLFIRDLRRYSYPQYVFHWLLYGFLHKISVPLYPCRVTPTQGLLLTLSLLFPIMVPSTDDDVTEVYMGVRRKEPVR
jgi:hypothetical protein